MRSHRASFEVLEPRAALSADGLFPGIGDSNHDGRTDNLDLESAICHLATAQVSRPAAGTAYQLPSAPLFAPGGPVYTDAVQGGLADCYLIADLAEVALKSPATIRSMFVDNEDGTFTFRYFSNANPYLQPGTPQEIVIDKWLPTGYADYSRCTWAALAEKAYAQIVGDYSRLNFGSYCQSTLGQITGQQWLFPFSGFSAVEEAFDSGCPISLETGSAPPDPGIVQQHAYALISCDADTATIYNPWGFTQTVAAAVITNRDNFRAIVGVQHA